MQMVSTELSLKLHLGRCLMAHKTQTDCEGRILLHCSEWGIWTVVLWVNYIKNMSMPSPNPGCYSLCLLSGIFSYFLCMLSLCSPGCPGTCRNPSASTSPVVGLKACATTTQPGLKEFTILREPVKKTSLSILISSKNYFRETVSSTKLLWQGAIAFPLGKDVAVLTKKKKNQPSNFGSIWGDSPVRHEDTVLSRAQGCWPHRSSWLTSTFDQDRGRKWENRWYRYMAPNVCIYSSEHNWQDQLLLYPTLHMPPHIGRIEEWELG